MNANTEQNLIQRMAELEARITALEQGNAGMSPAPLPRILEGSAPAVSHDVLHETWQHAPLMLRLRFVQELLSEAHPYHAVLKEAVALSELLGRSSELETWIARYSSLFAEAVERLTTELPTGQTASEKLAVETLSEARRTLETSLAPLGLEWVLPAVGSRITSEQEVVGEQECSVVPGTVARVRRRGFRQRGTLVLPAQVIRAIPLRNPTVAASAVGPMQHPVGTTALATSGNGEVGQEVAAANVIGKPETHASASTPEVPRLAEVPDWLRTFLQRSAGNEHPTIRQLSEGLQAVASAVSQASAGHVSESALAETFAPLLPLFGSRHIESLYGVPPQWGAVIAETREGMLQWLRSAGFELISPATGEPFDASTMQAVGARRTAHPHEDNTVAKVEQVGLRYGASPLFRAQVVRYELESGM